jgi:hypothetical protein
MIGMSVASSYTMFEYFVNKTFERFSDFVESVAYDGMLNTWDADHLPAGQRAAPFGSPPAAAQVPRAPTPTVGEKRAACGHVPVPVRMIAGWDGSTRGRCSVCDSDKLVTTVCSECSSADGVVWVHPEARKWKDTVITASCCARHAAHPELSKKSHASASAKTAANNRRGGRGRGGMRGQRGGRGAR